MKKWILLSLLGGIVFLSSCNNKSQKVQANESEVASHAPVETETNSNGEPWTEQQLMEPRELAQVIKTSTDSPVIISLGAGGIIPGSKDTGASGEKKGLQNLKEELEAMSKDTEIVLYCGCCPFDICPNVRPAFSLLNDMGFKNHHLLNLRDNIKVDWIDRGYPTGN
ncbi:rhodanese-like domain-containing protein [Salinimicrobium xinjiangense]|uniref:rhodanese-like domain-containing protein n=1 Tax=Salinimicrobium xinjiangense TaxID=438596 RepID=UPI00040A7401|nr:rhodanese-like domain-containing protein [Salinimicrobium xinjiangense]